MTPRPGFDLGGILIAPGSRRTVDLPVSVLSDHTPVTMSAQVIHGRRKGPVVFVTAGVHGDEVIGVEIVRRLLNLPSLTALAGTLIAIPIVNAFGFLNLSRYLPDRRDLNRCFPGSPGGSMAARLAHLLTCAVAPAQSGHRPALGGDPPHQPARDPGGPGRGRADAAGPALRRPRGPALGPGRGGAAADGAGDRSDAWTADVGAERLFDEDEIL